MIGSASFVAACVGVLTLSGAGTAWGPRFSPASPSRAVEVERQLTYDITARLRISSDGEGNHKLRVNFENIGPVNSPAFQFQAYRYIQSPSGLGSGVAVNSLQNGSVPSLAARSSGVKVIPGGKWEKYFDMSGIVRGTTYVFRITYSPALNDANNANHKIELKYTAP